MTTEQELAQVRKTAAAGRLREAAAACLEILKREPQNVAAIALYGDLAMDMQQRAEAVVIFRKLLEIDPKHSIAHERLAALAEKEGDYPAARSHAQTALQLNPQSLMALTVIASVLLAEGREQDALDALDDMFGVRNIERQLRATKTIEVTLNKLHCQVVTDGQRSPQL